MPGIAEVLLFEGIPRRKGGNMFGKTCKRTKRVRSTATGKMVTRCAEFSGGSLGSLGALPFDFDALKGTLLTGAVAVGGAVLAARGVGYLAPMIKIDPTSSWIMVLEVALGLVAGYAVGKYAKQPDLGAAVALGPVVVNGLRLVGMFLAPGGETLAGRRPNVRASQPLGAVVPAGTFPEWMFRSEYQDRINQQLPDWAMGA
jgi:hypothetical protein